MRSADHIYLARNSRGQSFAQQATATTSSNSSRSYLLPVLSSKPFLHDLSSKFATVTTERGGAWLTSDDYFRELQDLARDPESCIQEAYDGSIAHSRALELTLAQKPGHSVIGRIFDLAKHLLHPPWKADEESLKLVIQSCRLLHAISNQSTFIQTQAKQEEVRKTCFNMLRSLQDLLDEERDNEHMPKSGFLPLAPLAAEIFEVAGICLDSPAVVLSSQRIFDLVALLWFRHAENERLSTSFAEVQAITSVLRRLTFHGQMYRSCSRLVNAMLRNGFACESDIAESYVTLLGHLKWKLVQNRFRDHEEWGIPVLSTIEVMFRHTNIFFCTDKNPVCIQHAACCNLRDAFLCRTLVRHCMEILFAIAVPYRKVPLNLRTKMFVASVKGTTSTLLGFLTKACTSYWAGPSLNGMLRHGFLKLMQILEATPGVIDEKARGDLHTIGYNVIPVLLTRPSVVETCRRRAIRAHQLIITASRDPKENLTRFCESFVETLAIKLMLGCGYKIAPLVCFNPCCGKDERKTHLRLCKGCQSAYFCSRRCQRQAWPEHSLSCSALAKEEEGNQPDPALTHKDKTLLRASALLTLQHSWWNGLKGRMSLYDTKPYHFAYFIDMSKAKKPVETVSLFDVKAWKGRSEYERHCWLNSLERLQKTGTGNEVTLLLIISYLDDRAYKGRKATYVVPVFIAWHLWVERCLSLTNIVEEIASGFLLKSTATREAAGEVFDTRIQSIRVANILRKKWLLKD